MWGSCFWFCIPPPPPPPPPHPPRPLSHTIFDTQLCHPQLCHTPSLTFTLSLSPTTLTHTIFHIHTIFVIHHLSQLCHTHPLWHTPCFTHHVSHTIFHTPCFTFTHYLCDIHLRFAWQAWLLVTSTFVHFAGQAWYLWHWAGSGGALGRAWARFSCPGRRATLRGKRGTWW